MKMRNIIIISLIMMLSLTSIVNADIIITEEQFSSLTNETIANYMIDNFVINRYIIDYDNLYIYYNITTIEPTHDNNTYRVFNYEYPTTVSREDLLLCLELTNNNYQACNGYLISNTESITIEVFDNELNESINKTIVPTWLQAYNEGISSYNNIIDLRDNIINLNMWGLLIG